jgi:hypothetical protein
MLFGLNKALAGFQGCINDRLYLFVNVVGSADVYDILIYIVTALLNIATMSNWSSQLYRKQEYI